MTIKRALGVMVLVLVLLACGPGGEKPAASPASPRSPASRAEQGSKAGDDDVTVLRDHFVWGDESQPARDWDVDAEACKGRLDQHPKVRKGAHPLVKVAVFIQCMEEMGWVNKGENR